MVQRIWNRWVIFMLIGGVCASPVSAEEKFLPGQAASGIWAPKLYGFCMEISDTRQRSLAQQARMLCELGLKQNVVVLFQGLVHECRHLI